MKPEVIQDIGERLGGMTAKAARKAIDDYFAAQVWSLEKAEWEQMTEAEKNAFVRVALKGNPAR